MANTTWSTTDKSATVTLSGSNLIATAAAAGGLFVRAIDQQIAGKFYWEIKPTVWGSSNTGVGFCPGPAVLTTPSGSSGAQMIALFKAGSIWADGVNTGVTLGARAANDVIGIAVDFAARLVWFRVAAAGNWNGSAANNPATGVGGVPFTVAAIGLGAFPLATLGANLDSVTANFGDTAFTGAVPSGYTSGFTAGASVPTNAIASQALAEHWLTTNPAAQITSVVAEHWASVASGNLQAVATFVALEHWTSVAVVVPASGGPQVTMIH